MKTESPGTILGLNNRLPLSRMTTTLPNRASAAYLRAAENIDLTEGGFIRRRRGYALAAAGEWHSLWADKDSSYGVVNGNLVSLSASLTQTVAVTSVGHRRISYARLPDGLVYWSNGERIGRLEGSTSRAMVTPMPNPVPVAMASSGGLPPGKYQVCFTALGVDGESASTEPVQIDLPNGGGIAFSGLTSNTRVYATAANGEIFNEIALGNYVSPANFGATCPTFMLAEMPAGDCLSHYRGSLLVARGKFLYISEPYRYGLFKPSRSFIPFPKEISVVQPCEDGVYVCADQTYWIPGDPLNTSLVAVSPLGALPGSATFDTDSKTAYWQSPVGAVIAKPGGAIATPQEDDLTFTSAQHGHTWVREALGDKHLITTRFNV